MKTMTLPKPFLLLWMGVLIALFTSCCEDDKLLHITDLRCEYTDQAVGIDIKNPRLTWAYDGDDDKFLQCYYQISVATSLDKLENGIADVWQSMRIQGSEQKTTISDDVLKSDQVYYWNVTVWDNRSNKIVSPINSFTTSNLGDRQWATNWITDANDKDFRPSPLFRKEFELDSLPSSAFLSIGSAGYYEVFINGKRVGDNYLDPGYTHFNKRLLYVTHDVSNFLVSGKNAIAVVLGNGWYNVQTRAVWDFEKAHWRNRPRFMSELNISLSDGTRRVIVADSSWKTSTGPYQFNNLYSGDVYDASKEEAGWKLAGFDDANWGTACVVEQPAPIIQAQLMPGIHITEVVDAIAFRKLSDSLYVYDMGRNFSGFSRITVSGDSGTRIAVRHGELLKEDGRLEQGNINIYYKPEDPKEGFQEDVYLLKGVGEETFQPSFTYHGFQYVEVESDRPIKLGQESVSGLLFNTDLAEVGGFECSNETLNRIYQATRNSYLSNLHSIPTDCPQREKNGWTADAHIAIDLALLNYDGILLYEKWMNDFVDNQRSEGDISGIIPSSGWGYGEWIGPSWDAAMFIIPHALYMYYGETKAIETIYPVAERYLAYLATKEKDGLLAYGLGDWVPWSAKTPIDYTSSCFYYLDYLRMSEFAKVLGKDATPFEKKAAQIKRLINHKYFNEESASYANGTQTALSLALYLGIVPEKMEKAVADKLAESVKANNCYLDFGVMGSKCVLPMLTKYGYVELAYAMASKTDAPSWGYWVDQKGMTTLGETWTMSPQFADASLNHVFMGDVIAWMQNSLAGINYDPQAPGFKRVLLKPHFVKDLDYAEGQYYSVKGLITASWSREGSTITYKVMIPPNMEATAYLNQTYELKAGTHSFVINE